MDMPKGNGVLRAQLHHQQTFSFRRSTLPSAIRHGTETRLSQFQAAV